jgi:hypothetical protein
MNDKTEDVVMAEEHEVSLKRSEFWMRAAAVSFGLWALLIPIGISMLRESATAIASQQREFLSRFDTYVLQVERRMIVLEERQSRNLEAVSKHEMRLDSLERDSPFGKASRKPKE